MNTTATGKKLPDPEQVKAIKRLLAQPGGQRLVEKRYGEDVAKTAEFKVAQRQREQAKRRQQMMRSKGNSLTVSADRKPAQKPKATAKPQPIKQAAPKSKEVKIPTLRDRAIAAARKPSTPNRSR